MPGACRLGLGATVTGKDGLLWSGGESTRVGGGVGAAGWITEGTLLDVGEPGVVTGEGGGTLVGLVMGVYFRKNFLFLNVVLPVPSTLTKY